MSSTQLNFFITPSEWTEIVQFLDNQNIKEIKEEMNDPRQIKLEDIKSHSKQQPKTIVLTKPIFADHIFFDYDQVNDKYSLSRLKSYVLEFSPGGFFQNNLNVLHRGRFYCVNSYYTGNGEQVVKNPDFIEWIKTVYKLFKKEFLVKAKEERMIWLSKNTIQWMQESHAAMDPTSLTIR